MKQRLQLLPLSQSRPKPTVLYKPPRARPPRPTITTAAINGLLV